MKQDLTKAIRASMDLATDKEAKDEIDLMINEVIMGASPEDVLYERNLEPDYVMHLMHLI